MSGGAEMTKYLVEILGRRPVSENQNGRMHLKHRVEIMGFLSTGEDRHEMIIKELAERLQDLEQVVFPENERAGLSWSEWKSTIG